MITFQREEEEKEGVGEGTPFQEKSNGIYDRDKDLGERVSLDLERVLLLFIPNSMAKCSRDSW